MNTEEKQLVELARSMPPLRHKVGDTFSVETSEVCKWLLNQPVAGKILFSLVHQYAKAIVYNPVSGTWQGKGCPNGSVTEETTC